MAAIGTSPDVVHQGENERLNELLAKRGAVISELRPGIALLKTIYPRRNRIRSGLGKTVAVVKATNKSGSFVIAFRPLE